MSVYAIRKYPKHENSHWLRVLLLVMIVSSLAACQRSAAPQPAPPMPVQSKVEPVPQIVVLPPWMPSDETQVVSNGVSFAWHDVSMNNDNTYFVYSLTSDPDAGGPTGAVPIDPVLRTDPSSATRPGQAVPLASWRGVSTGVLVFPGCVEDGQYMQIEFDRLTTDQGEHNGPWTLQPLVHPADTELRCGGSMDMPNGLDTEYAGKTIAYNSRGAYLGNMAYDIQRISKGLPPSPPEVDSELIPDDVVSLVPHPAETDPPGVPGATSTPVPFSPPQYLERVTLRILDEPSQAVQFVVITIGLDGQIEAQTYEGMANPIESLLPTVPPSPISP